MIDIAEIGRALRDARKQRGWTQADAAKRAAVGVRLWCEVETGKRLNVSGNTLLAMLNTMGVSLVLAGNETP